MKKDFENGAIDKNSIVDQTKNTVGDLGSEQVLSAASQGAAAVGGKFGEQVSKASTFAGYANTAYQLGNSAASKNRDNSSNFAEQVAASTSVRGTPTNTVSNAAAIVSNHILGVSHLVHLKLIVEGKELKYYKSFQLNQSATGHHNFNLVLSHDALGGEETYQMEEAQRLLGKRLLVSFSYKNIVDKPERDFIGVVTDISFQQAHGSRGYLVLTGYSPTILLDGAPHLQSFGGSTSVPLNTVVNQVLEQGYTQGGKYDFSIKSSKNFSLSYSSQYNESHYNFLSRTAEAYGEQFFYDGTCLHFGDLPLGEEPIKMVYGRDVDDIKVHMQTRHVNREFYGYNSSNHEKLSPGGVTQLEHKASIAKSAYSISQDTFTTPSLQMAPIKASTNKDIEMVQRGVGGSVGVGVFTTTGSTTVPFLYPGCVVELKMLKAGTNESNYFTKLMITDIYHSVDGLGHYTGTFEAIASDTGFLPRPDFHVPIAEQQIATVVNNKDSENKGRVQVQFDWQAGSANTEFIRVMTPDAGSSDKVGKNRGFMAIPEEGDQVMVGFVQQHPDRPFVMGGMFHGQVGGGGGTGNNVKSISSKSGHIFSLDDGGGMEIIDKDKNFVKLSGDGHVNVQSNETIQMSCGKSTFYMDKEGKISINGKQISNLAEDIEVIGSKQVTLGIGAEGQEPTSGFTAKAGTFDLKSGKLGFAAASEFKMTGVNIGINGSAETVVNGGVVKLN